MADNDAQHQDEGNKAMFGRKKDEKDESVETTEDGAEASASTPVAEVNRPQQRQVSQPARPASPRGEIPRRGPEIGGLAPGGRPGGSQESDGKKLIVGRDIVLNGEINSCDRLIVEGRVEANLTDCREIDVAETGTFKGEAEIDVAEISGTFEGTLIARELLLVRASGHVTGKVRFGQLEIERGGEIIGDVRTFGDDGGEKEATGAAETSTA
jgi:cytoskeletal protein CcmA (bactofilin family)